MYRKTQIFIMLLIWPAGFFLHGCYFQDQGRDLPGFVWSAGNKGETLPEMIPGQTRSIQFQFVLEKRISQVRFEIADPKLKEMGISIRYETVPVKEGIASSQAIFEIKEKTRPWHYSLKIIVKDAETGKVVGRGTVPFAVYPYSFNVLNCSC
jgi:hypothetical protein